MAEPSELTRRSLVEPTSDASLPQNDKCGKVASIVASVILAIVLIIAVVGYMQATNQLSGTTFSDMTEGGSIAVMGIAALGIAVILGRLLWKAYVAYVESNNSEAAARTAHKAKIEAYKLKYKDQFPLTGCLYKCVQEGQDFIVLLTLSETNGQLTHDVKFCTNSQEAHEVGSSHHCRPCI